MEVHHPSHAAGSHQSAKKKWTSYLLEFFMLFLAVFLGFIAENVREHKVEHKRAREFAKSLVQDLQEDIEAIKEQSAKTASWLNAADSILTLSQKKLEGPAASAFCFYARFMYWTGPVNWHRTTFEQIKNSGSLRYFNYDIVTKLLNYNAVINNIQDEFENHEIRGNMLLTPLNKIIDPVLHHDLSKYYIWTLDSIPPDTKRSLLSFETGSLEPKREEVREFMNMVVVQQRNLRYGYTTRLPNAIEAANELIAELKKDYHLF